MLKRQFLCAAIQLAATKLANLYIIAGCNGAGKTTASFTVLPELLQVREFVNADEIARGLSPFQPEKVSIEAGRIMLRRLQDLLGCVDNRRPLGCATLRS